MEEIINRLSYAAATYSFEGRNYPNCIVFREDLENLINKYKEQEKIIELMAKELAVCGGFDYVEFGMSTGDFNKDIKNMIDYFKKKARDENE